MLGLIIYQTYLFIHFDQGSMNAWAMVQIPEDFRELLLVVLVLNAAACYLFEKCFIGWYSNKYEEQQATLRKKQRERILQGILERDVAPEEHYRSDMNNQQ